MARRQSCQVRVPDIQGGWEYDPKAIEFEHAKVIHERNRIRRPPEHDRQADGTDYDKGAMIRQLRDGALDRANVRALAVHLSPLIGMRRPDSNLCTDANVTLSSSSKKANDTNVSSSKMISPISKVNQRIKPSILSSIEEPIASMTNAAQDCAPRYKHDTVRHIDSGNRRKTSVLHPSTAEQASKEHTLRPNPSRALDALKNDFGEPIRERIFENTDEELYEPLQWNPEGLHRRDLTNKEAQEQLGASGGTINTILTGDLNSRGRKDWPVTRFDFDQHDTQITQRCAALDADRHTDMKTSEVRLGDFRHHSLQTENHRFEDRLMSYGLQSQPLLGSSRNLWCESHEPALDVLARVQAALPPPKPTSVLKWDLYKDPYVFSTIDRHAMSVARQEYNSFEQVVYQLNRGCTTQLERARAIFQWLSVRNLNHVMHYDQSNTDSLHYLFGGIKEGLGSYHELFRLLGSLAGLPVKLIHGISKCAGYRPGMSFTDGQFRNAWTAVYIDGEWRFVDSHWGSRHIAKSTSHSGANDLSPLCYALDEFFFLADPDQFIYMHFPDESQWQLLSRPISVEDFIDKPLVKSQFFQFGLEFVQWSTAVINSENGTVEVVLRRNNHKLMLAFNTRLEQNRTIVDGYVIYHKQKYDVIFNVSLPNVGCYSLSIFACDIETSDVFHNICSFQINCTAVVNKPFCRFPYLPDGYGLTPLAEELGLRVDKYSEYYLVSNRDKMTLDLNFTCPVKIAHKMTNSYGEYIPVGGSHSGERTIGLSSFAFQRYRDHAFVSYVLRFPERGIYLFSVYAGYKQSQSDTLECVVRYLIQCNTKPDASKHSSTLCAYPQTLQYWLRCRLHEPTAGQLRINKTVTFKIEVPEADSVAVIIGQQWFYLEKESSGDNKVRSKAESRTDALWIGSVNTGKDPRLTVTVSARLRHEGVEYCPMLDYKLYDSGGLV